MWLCDHLLLVLLAQTINTTVNTAPPPSRRHTGKPLLLSSHKPNILPSNLLRLCHCWVKLATLLYRCTPLFFAKLFLSYAICWPSDALTPCICFPNSCLSCRPAFCASLLVFLARPLYTAPSTEQVGYYTTDRFWRRKNLRQILFVSGWGALTPLNLIFPSRPL